MKRYLPILAGIAFVLLIVLVFARLRGGGDDDGGTERAASRYLVCEACGVISILETDSDFVRQRYEAGEVRAAGADPRFKCPSCEEIAVRIEILDFQTGVVRCEQCGKDLIASEHAAAVAVEAGDVKLGKDKRLQYRCADCGDFHGRMVSRDAPMDPE
jgi:hypothetical protein